MCRVDERFSDVRDEPLNRSRKAEQRVTYMRHEFHGQRVEVTNNRLPILT